MNIYGAFLLGVSSTLLIAYSQVADEKGWPQGTFFRNQKAMLLGWVGFMGSLIFSYLASGFTGLFATLVGSWLLSGAILGALRSQSQIVGLIGFVAGCIITYL